jgi:hypothetical protein
MRHFLGRRRDEQRQMIAARPGIYVWSIDMMPASGVSRTSDEHFTFLQTRLQRATPQRWASLETGRAGNFRRVAIYDEPPPLTEATRRRLVDLNSPHHTNYDWALNCAAAFSRPLYVGKASRSVFDRISKHIRPNSLLYEQLAHVGLAPIDCVVHAMYVPGGAVDPVDEDADAAVGVSGALPDGDDAADLDEDALWPDAQDALLPPDADAVRRRLDQLVHLAESLTIRTAHPLLNKQMD